MGAWGVVRADDGDDRLGVALHAGPGGVAVGLVADLVDHMLGCGIALGHLVPKVLCLGKVDIGVQVVQHVPIDDDVHVRLLGERNAIVDEGAQRVAVAARAPAAVLVGVDGQARQVGAPSCQLGEACGVHVLRKPRQAVRGEPLELHRVFVLVCERGAHNLQASAFRGARDARACRRGGALFAGRVLGARAVFRRFRPGVFAAARADAREGRGGDRRRCNEHSSRNRLLHGIPDHCDAYHKCSQHG